VDRDRKGGGGNFPQKLSHDLRKTIGDRKSIKGTARVFFRTRRKVDESSQGGGPFYQKGSWLNASRVKGKHPKGQRNSFRGG